MQFVRIRVSALAALLVVGGFAAAQGCGGQTGGGGGAQGGEGDEGGGGRAGEGGPGGQAGGQAGTGGKTGGSGGGGAKGGQAGGGSGGGGAAGKAGSGGGAAGAGGGGAGGQAGAAGQAAGGAAGSPVDATAFCKPENYRDAAKDGVYTSPVQGLKPVPAGVKPGKGISGNAGGLAYTGYVSGNYDDAADGKVALMIYPKAENVAAGASHYDNQAIIGAIQSLTFAGQMPAVVSVLIPFPGDHSQSASATFANTIATKVFPALKQQYPKLSTDAAYHLIGGQSTAGAQAFDIAWAKPDFFSKVRTNSGSFVCFMNGNMPYLPRVDGSRAGKLRVSLTVGTCDIYGKVSDVPAACNKDPDMCQNDGACVDSSGCNASWLAANQDVQKKLSELKYETRLWIIPDGTHTPFTWQSTSYDDLSWLWRPVMCK